MCKKANKAKDGIINVRKSCENTEKYSPDRNKLYQDIAPFLDEIKGINQDLGHARSELNKIIEDKNIENKSLRNARIFNAVLLIVAIGAWLYPRAPS